MIPDRAETARRTAPRTILLVEDEPDARTILARRLQAFGWNCLAHPSVASAMQHPDLRYVEAVVADVVLGERKLSGIELIAALPRQEVRAPVDLGTASAGCSPGPGCCPGSSSPTGCARSTSRSPTSSRIGRSCIRWWSSTVFSGASPPA